MNQQNDNSERRVTTKEQIYSEGFDTGFRAGFIEGCQSRYAKGYDDATRIMIKEVGF